MIIVVHILIALSGLLSAAYGLIIPSKRKLQITYGLTAGTIVSGALLIVVQHAPMLQTCVTGLTYVAIILVATAIAHYRLHKVSAEL